MYLIPIAWLFLSALELWRAVHQGGEVRYIAAFGFGCLAALFYIGQKHRYQAVLAKKES